MGLRQVIDNVFFNIPKTLFAFALKVFANRATEALLDDLIGINKGKLEPPGKLTPDGGFAGTGEADEADQNIFQGRCNRTLWNYEIPRSYGSKRRRYFDVDQVSSVTRKYKIGNCRVKRIYHDQTGRTLNSAIGQRAEEVT